MKKKLALLLVMLSCFASSSALAQDLPTLEAEPVLMRHGAVAGHESLHRELTAGALDVEQPFGAWSLLQPTSIQNMFAQSLGSMLRAAGLDALDAQGQLSPIGALHSQLVEGANRWLSLATAAPNVRMRISSRFGMRFHPVLKKWKLHNGVDYAAPTGTPVHAAADGVVKAAGWAGPSGKLVLIKHDDGYITGYAHLNKIMPGIIPGARVSSLDMIGHVGTTGRSTGPHLHFTIRKDGKFVDPLSAQDTFAYEAPIRQVSEFEVAYRKEIRPVLLSLFKQPTLIETASR